MNKIILIADNYDLFNNSIEIPEADNIVEVQAIEKPQASTSELSFVANKMAISFGAMILSIVFLVIILVLFKKIRDKNRTIQNYVNNQVKVQTTKVKVAKQTKQCCLETPISIKDGINSFLNRTL